MCVLVKLLGGTSAVGRSGGGGVVVHDGRRPPPTVFRVPPVAAMRPRRLFLDRREKVIHGVRDYHVVIGGHEERRDHAGQPDACTTRIVIMFTRQKHLNRKSINR